MALPQNEQVMRSKPAELVPHHPMLINRWRMEAASYSAVAAEIVSSRERGLQSV